MLFKGIFLLFYIFVKSLFQYMPKILVTGGCGYIGSHTAVDLLDGGYDVISIDTFYNSFENTPKRIEKITQKKFYNERVDIRDLQSLKDLFRSNPEINGIIHFAALKSVGESMEKPIKYYDYNVGGMINLLKCVLDFEIPYFIFSSSCTVYGQPKKIPVTEETPMGLPQSIYGHTKQICEQMLEQACRQRPELNALSLRYFNPAGAHPSGLLGELSKLPASNLVPVITETAIGKRGSMMVHGNEYPTRDGSCIRDYIHICDLARAHTQGLEFLAEGIQEKNPEIINLGIGEGVTVLEAIKAFESVSEQPLNYTIGPKRPGDVAAIYTNYEKARDMLGWEPKFNIRDIMATAWKWEKNLAAESSIAGE
jgi:UDP-glucose 4-epimerase